ncbi:hypothetical protein JSE7799_01564 [Jannaschia seosinensis]|uniref:Uncharacterized protein n=1 Tax=Jannaschia seosinensis TaxID=313367 RepID=A0A0M7BC50_9RHOB|nr:hypothetical protein [Jannaschia seosinensis]CUH38846.1 hypothetical protein JSE7799_01564 [Jannaschia seosinensis]
MVRWFPILAILAACQPASGSSAGEASPSEVLSLLDRARIAMGGNTALADPTSRSAVSVSPEDNHDTIHALGHGSIVDRTIHVVGPDLASGTLLRNGRSWARQVSISGTDSRALRTSLLTPYARRPDAQVQSSSTGQNETVELQRIDGRGVLRVTASSPPLRTGRMNRIQIDGGNFVVPDMQDTIGLTLRSVEA